MRAVCFTGHRNAHITADLRVYVIKLLESLIKKGTDTFYVGKACGWDNDCPDLVLELRDNPFQKNLKNQTV